MDLEGKILNDKIFIKINLLVCVFDLKDSNVIQKIKRCIMEREIL